MLLIYYLRQPRKLKKLDDFFKRVDEGQVTSPDELAQLAKFENRISSAYEANYYKLIEDFKALGLEGRPTWRPSELQKALFDVRARPNVEAFQVAEAEMAYEKILRTLQSDFNQYGSLVNRSGEIIRPGYNRALAHHMRAIYKGASEAELSEINMTLRSAIKNIDDGRIP